MSSLVYLVPLALLLGAVALGAFLWSLRSGQYDDMQGAAERILFDGDEPESYVRPQQPRRPSESSWPDGISQAAIRNTH
ncbi:cbb3-type cytochrome oxidase assembly protein CcoS [Mesorhizobium sp. IMUNJ 23232]|uniref:cbb3-type cytochrome oxidase assembly protein CcoS n=1 Tax=Mesorhizobium sp. IMUNJ 23232 TaxID=3376064 RepID=UPI0037A04CC7